MTYQRTESRKTFNSSGQLYIAGELLNFIGYDISVKGIQVEILPGLFLSEAEDFEKLMQENTRAEIFVKDLMLTGEADIVWVQKNATSIMLGLAFREVIYNAEKLWHKRRYYRKYKKANGLMHCKEIERRVQFESINISTDGIMIHLTERIDYTLQPGMIVQLCSTELALNALAKIAWVDKQTQSTLGLKYLQ